MVTGNCAVIGCTNSSYTLKKWKKEVCSIHNTPKKVCECQRPFHLFFFPSELRNSVARKRWIQIVRRTARNKKEWKPGTSDRICSNHFVNGEPTLENPDPILDLGYEKEMKSKRRVLKRGSVSLQKKSKKIRSLENVDTSLESPIFEEDIPTTSSNNNLGLETHWALADHSYCAKEGAHNCSGCCDKAELIKSLVRKINKLNISSQRGTITAKNGNFSHTKIKTDKKMSFYTGLTSVLQFEVIFSLIKPFFKDIR